MVRDSVFTTENFQKAASAVSSYSNNYLPVRKMKSSLRQSPRVIAPIRGKAERESATLLNRTLERNDIPLGYKFIDEKSNALAPNGDVST